MKNPKGRMEAINRQAMPMQQRKDLDKVALYLKFYIERWHKQPDTRHSKTIIVFEGDRCKPSKMELHFRKAKKGGEK